MLHGSERWGNQLHRRSGDDDGDGGHHDDDADDDGHCDWILLFLSIE